MTSETFVSQDGIEVKKTGRIATKPGVGRKVLTMVEIEPVNEYDGLWKKWVLPTSLFHIQAGTTSDNLEA